jgi:hypothetical protein
MADESETKPAEMTQPILIDLGARKPRDIKDLKKGQGELWEEVLNVVDETREMLGAKVEGKVLVPVVLIYSKKSRRKSLGKVLFPYLR